MKLNGFTTFFLDNKTCKYPNIHNKRHAITWELYLIFIAIMTGESQHEGYIRVSKKTFISIAVHLQFTSIPLFPLCLTFPSQCMKFVYMLIIYRILCDEQIYLS